MPPLLLQFQLYDESVIADLLHELNLHEDVVARRQDVPDSAPVVVAVAVPDVAALVWSARSTVTLFDPLAVELLQDQPR